MRFGRELSSSFRERVLSGIGRAAIRSSQIDGITFQDVTDAGETILHSLPLLSDTSAFQKRADIVSASGFIETEG